MRIRTKLLLFFFNVIGLQPGSLETIKIPHPHKPCHRIQWNLYELQTIATPPLILVCSSTSPLIGSKVIGQAPPSSYFQAGVQRGAPVSVCVFGVYARVCSVYSEYCSH